MKKIIASAGLIAVGTASLQAAAYAPGLNQQEASKPWSVAGSLRGFYDDNYASVYSAEKKGSGGIEFRPSAAYNLQMEQTLVSLSYEYGLKYYFDRVGKDTDQSHQVNGRLEHTFAERYRLQLSDSFVYSQEPELIDANNQTVTAYRSDAEAYRNNATLNLTAQLTEVISSTVGYYNGYYDYVGTGAGSYSATLDRWVSKFYADAAYLVREDTKLGLGYSYWINDYRSRDHLTMDTTSFLGDDRDNSSHVLYALAEHSFSPKVKGDIKVGAQYVDFSNPLFEDSWSPYADLNGYYYYLPNSYVQLGVNVQRSPTDFAGGGTATDYVTDQTAANIVASINHQITAQLSGSIFGQYQYGLFEGKGTWDGAVDNLFAAGVNLEYRINSFWSADLGYNFDRVDSDDYVRSYSRNRVYGGVRAQY